MMNFRSWSGNLKILVEQGKIKPKRHLEGSNVIKIYGPPGTGKTTLAIEMVKWLTEGNCSDLSQIVYCAFTKSANEESLQKLAASGLDVEAATNFSTLHSLGFKSSGIASVNLLKRSDFIEFCKSVNLSYSVSSSNTIYNLEDLFNSGNNTSPGIAFQGLMTYQMNTWIPDDELYKKQSELFNFGGVETFARLKQAYKEFKQFKYKFDYNDMLVSAYVRTPPKGEVLFVDEAQDLSPFQWKIIEKWIPYYKLVVIIGDDDQAIYRFLGGSAQLFNNQPATDIVLTNSHRMPVNVYNTSIKVLERIKSRFSKEFSPNIREGAVFKGDYKDIKFNQLGGTSFCLFRNKVYMQEAVNYFIENNINFGFIRAKRSSDILKLAVLVNDIQTDSLVELSNIYYCRKHYPQETVTEDFRTVIKNYRYSKDTISIPQLRGLGFGNFIDNMRHENYALFKSFNTDNKIEFDYYLRLLRKFSYSEVANPKLKIGTMHSSKGLEADNVYINDLATRKTYENGEVESFREDEARLMYVAMTRTKNNLILQRHDIAKNYMVY